MNEEDIKEIERELRFLESANDISCKECWKDSCINCAMIIFFKDKMPKLTKNLSDLLQAYKDQEKEIDKLKNKNSELLIKLRNRGKEVNKLTKYSNYKKEFTTLNNRIKELEKVIDEMAKVIEITEECDACGYEESHECDNCIKQFYINKVKENKDD